MAGGRGEETDKNPCPHEAYILVEETDNKEIHKICVFCKRDDKCYRVK